MNQEKKYIRSFIAIDLPDKVKEKIYKSVSNSISQEVKYARIIKPNNYHITLKFLGEISENRITRIKKDLNKIDKKKINFDLKFDTTGIFPIQGPPRILWLGFMDMNNNLDIIYKEINQILKPLGFKKEKRKFTPHITLCRFKDAPFSDIEKINKLREEINSKIKKEMEDTNISITSLILFKSELTPDGSIYSKLDTVSEE